MKKPFLHLNEKTLLYMLLTALLLANLAAIHTGLASADETKLHVDPPSIVDPTVTPGKSFSINVTIANVTDLYGFEFKLQYNTTILTGLGVIIVPFPNQTDYTSDTSMDDEKGVILVNVTYHSPAKPLNTTDPVTLARIFFLVIAVGSTDLDLYDTKLVDSSANEIPHDAIDGYFSNRLLLPPVALFTHSPLLPLVNETVIFNASASYDPDGTIVSYSWNFSDGTPIVNETDPTTTHSYTAIGTYEVTLTVTDNDGLTNSTTHFIRTRASSTITCSVSPDAILIGESVTVSGDIQPDHDGVTVTLDFTKPDDAHELVYTTTNSTGGFSAVYTPDMTGDWSVTASWEGYEDHDGATSAPASFTVTLLPEVGWIDGTVIDAETLDAIEGATVEAARAHPRGAYFAVTDANGYYKIEVSAPATYNVIASAEGHRSQTVYNVFVNAGASVTIDFALELTPVPPAASFTWSLSEPVAGEEVTFTSASIDPDGTILGWEWDFNGDGAVDGTTENATWTYDSAGTYNVTLTVTDDDGLTSTATKSITVKEAPPPPYAMYSVAVIAIVVLSATAIYYLRKKR